MTTAAAAGPGLGLGLDARRSSYSRLATALAHLDDDDLRSLVRGRAAWSGGWWGSHATIDVAGEKVFVKRIPVTARELEHPYSTRNRYRLPTRYNYGVGSAGFGAFREIVTHVKTTNWVLEGAIETFPLLYHHRVVRRWFGPPSLGPSALDDYVAYWNGSKAVRTYISARTSATHEALLFVEHVPHTLGPWLVDHLDGLDGMLDQLWATISFLRGEGVVHFDAHFHNVVTDGVRPYLTDFGLTLDARHQLTATERAFLDRHSHYDYGEVLWNVGFLLHSLLEVAPGEATLASLIERMDAADAARLPASYVERVHQWQEAILLMNDFYAAMRASSRKDAVYDDARLRRIIERQASWPNG